MNLLFYAPQMAEYGGIERHVCSLATLMAEHGHRVTLVTTSNSLGADLRSELAHPLITLRELPAARHGAGKIRKLLWLVGEVMRARRQSWDIIYTNGQSALARVLWSASRDPATRRIHHHHTSADAGEKRTWSKGFRHLLQIAPELVACCGATRDAINAAVQRTRTVFIPVLARRPMAARDVVETTPRAPLNFGYAGRLIPEKGIDAICRLSADPALAHVVWHIHGAGPKYPPQFFQAWPRVVYHGAYHGAEGQARALLTLDAIVLFSTHSEGLPLTLSEGMSAGLPWVGTDRGGTRELAVSADNCLVVPHPASDADLRDAVAELSRRLLAGQTSRRLQRRIYDNYFGPDIVSQHWLAFFERRVSPPPIAAPGSVPSSAPSLASS